MKKGFSGAVILFGFLGVVSLSHAGSLSGTITLGVDAPVLKTIPVTKDQAVCGNERAPEALILSGAKGVANAVITVQGVAGGAVKSSGKIALVQEKCQFKPHLLVIPKGTAIDIVNNDPITHNIHTFARKNPTINKAQPASLKKFESPVFTEPETIKVQCDIHRGLMSAWFIVADAPTAVSDASGKFNIPDLPDGTYTVEIWHEALEKQTKQVTIKGGAATLDVSLMPKGKG